MKKNIALVIAAALLFDAYRANVRARQGIHKMADVNMYLANKIEENNVPWTDFDAIAIASFVD